jgi:16S rRNA (cytosine1402-N4)-methyltransferase
LGEGGHAEAFLTRFSNLRIVGVDIDPEIQARAKMRLQTFGARMAFHLGWFDDFFANFSGTPDLVLFDLGISVFHYRSSGRGFSFADQETLDMRLGGNGETAAEVVNTRTEEDLANLIFRYGEERYSRRIARAIVASRKGRGVASAAELANIVWEAVPGAYRRGGIHPATKTFQALRIAVNQELERLPRALTAAFSALSVQGKLGVITFHSLEDRIVKNMFRDWAKHCTCPPEQPICTCGGTPRGEVVTKKPVPPGETECRSNPPSRSAKLRVLRKLKE